jgi:hypothetical protein
MPSGSPSEVDGRIECPNRNNDTIGTPLEAEPLEVAARARIARADAGSDAVDHECAVSA